MNDKKPLARRALEACRNQLFFENRFLEQALFRLKWEDDGAVSFGSEGSSLFYSADYILGRYMQSPQQLMMDYLHTVMHCLYQHPFFVPQEQEKYWDLATDIAVECVLEEIAAGGSMTVCDTAEGQQRRSVIGLVRAKTSVMSAQKIFVFLLKNMKSEADFDGFFGIAYEELRALFKRDEHSLWYAQESGEGDREKQGGAENGGQQPEEDNTETEGQQPEEGSSETDDQQSEEDGPEADNGQPKKDSARANEQQSEKGSSEADDQQQKGNKTGTAGGQKLENRGTGNTTKTLGANRQNTQQAQRQLQQMWKGVAEQVLMEAQSFAKPARGDLSGNMVRTLQKLTRENYDYSAFLLKFAARLEERMQTDLDEFDYIFYTYGLRLDRRMPLVEPLEYKEKYLLREFVIAIDTSGSCEGDLVEKFLVKTYNILRQTESFTSKVKIHIIQCDAVIQEDVTIRSQKDLEEYIAHLQLKGFGGTDFRPVFTHIEHMIETGELQRLEGLLYFTDGYGIFPKKPPKYKTAFVFLDQENDVKVPAWAMKLYVDEEAL